MASISTTTMPELAALFVAAIIGVTPALTYQGGERWKHYDRATDAASRTRRFRLVWKPGPVVGGGYWGVNSQEVTSVLAVRTDYAGHHERLTHLIQSDWHQLRDVLAQLHVPITNGLTQLHATSSPPSMVADSIHGRAQLLDRAASSADVIQVDLTYDVRYMRARSAA